MVSEPLWLQSALENTQLPKPAGKTRLASEQAVQKLGLTIHLSAALGLNSWLLISNCLNPCQVPTLTEPHGLAVLPASLHSNLTTLMAITWLSVPCRINGVRDCVATGVKQMISIQEMQSCRKLHLSSPTERCQDAEHTTKEALKGSCFLNDRGTRLSSPTLHVMRTVYTPQTDEV